MEQVQIENRLKSAFPDGHILVMDLTGGGDHWEVRVSSSRFNGLSRIQRHQEVMKLFDAELKSGELHALSIKTLEQPQ